MPDSHSPAQRSYNMSRIRSSGTTPERRLGALLRTMFPDAQIIERPSELPGKPDFWLPDLHLAVFADGCFFHRCPRHFIMPENNQEYWSVKIARNSRNDRRNNKTLRVSGIRPVRIWEHNLMDDLTRARQQLRRAYRSAILRAGGAAGRLKTISFAG
jgi:DNA mismatch endonuclease (patch repair protein)